MNFQSLLLSISAVFLWFVAVSGVELTFELPDDEKQCFYEHIPINTSATLEYQVVTGGQYDVDVTLKAPNHEIIYKRVKTQFDSHTFTSEMSGEYVACFSNEFSTFTHKTVYMDFQVGEEQPLLGPGAHVAATAMTQMESAVQEIHKHLSTIEDYQTHHKLKEATSRKRAEELNERVMWWSTLETIVMLVGSICQVFIVKNFFSEKKTIQVHNRK